MPVAVDMEAAEDTEASAAEDMQVSAAAPVRAELVVTTLDPGLAVLLAATERGITRPESQQGATAVTAATDKGTMHREARLEIRFIVLLRVRKAESLPGSSLGRQSIRAAITSHEISPGLALPIGILASNAPAQPQGVQRGRTGLGHGRMQPTGGDSIRKQHKDCVTGKAERLDTPMQNVITTNTGVIVITTTMIGGVIIATLLFLLVGVFGVGMTVGGIRRGATIPIIHTTITMVRSMATMDSSPTT